MEAATETIKKNMDTYKIPPPRTLGDFLLNTSRYSIPAFSDLRRLNNRVICNLMYYQTNYFIISIIMFILFTLSGLRTILFGIFSAALIAATVLFFLGKLPLGQNYRSDHPVIVIGLAVVLMLTFFFALRAMLFVVLALITPLPIWFVHASMRMRNWKNKVTNKMEQIGITGLSNSPMGLLLHKVLGYDVKDIAENHSED